MELKEIALEVLEAMGIEDFGPEFSKSETPDPDDVAFIDRFATKLIARVKEEEGKDAVGYDAIFSAIARSVRGNGGLGISVKAFKDALGGEIFLSPTIPEGMALVPIEPTLDMGWAYLDAARESSPECEHVFNHPGYRAMLQAAGMTK